MKRFLWIDVAKGVGIILVILGHTRFPSEFMSRWITSFHMPLFYVLAGICYDEMRYPSYLVYLKRKAVALLYPYFTLSILVIILFKFLYVGDDQAIGTYNLFLNALKGGTFGAFWFITSLFCVEVLYAGFARLVKNTVLRVASMFAVSLAAAYLITGHLPYFFDATLTALFFYAFGHCVRSTLLEKARWQDVKRRVILTFGTEAIHLVVLVFFYKHKSDFVGHDFGNPLFYFFCALLGSYFIIFGSMCVDGWNHVIIKPIKRSVEFLGRNTIILLAFHNPLGHCRNSWVGVVPFMNGVSSVVVELILLGVVLCLLSGPCRWMITLKKSNMRVKE